jgi:DNA-binding SARP family transcriptional activator
LWRANVVRPRLLRWLRRRFSTPVTVVVAPPGFGKTTLLAQAIAENRLAPLGTDYWLACCAEQVAGSLLAEGLCLTMGIASPGNLDGAVDKIVEAMWHRSPTEVTLVVDDVHGITDSGAELLAKLIAALPQNGHLVLSGRQVPAVALARDEVQGRVRRLDESELLFTDQELAEFAQQRNVSTEQLTGSGGWPALTELAASAGPRIEATYLWEEVLQSIPPSRRRDLALLALVGHVDDDLASAVLGRDIDVAALTADLPLVATTASGGLQIHRLWQPYLAKVVDDAEVAEARRRAGLALAQAGDVASAVPLLADAGAWTDVTNVVADVLGAAHPPVAGDVVASWLGCLPEELAGGPLARLLAAVTGVQHDPHAAMRDLQAAADAFREEGNLAGELACMAQAGQMAWWSEDPLLLFGLAARLFEIEALGFEEARPLACLGRALIADLSADCEQVLAELDSIPPGSMRGTGRGLVDWLRSTSFNHLGRPAEALEAADAAWAHASPLLAPVTEGARAEALWHLGQIDEALRELPAIVDRQVATGVRDSTALVAAGACLAFAAAGQPVEAAAYLDLARRSAVSPDLPLIDVNLAVSEAAVAIAQGDEATAARVIEAYLERSASFGTGLAAFAQRRCLSVWYVLAPSTRDEWDKANLGPGFAKARDLSRALVAMRDNGELPALLPAPEEVRAAMPLNWVSELALARIAAGGQDGWHLLEAVWPQAQSEVRRHAEAADTPLARPARTALARLPVPPPGRLELHLLGPIELWRDGEPVEIPEWRRQRVRSLLAHLVLHRPVHRERLAADLWPTLDAGAQSRNLRVTLTHLLRVLEPERGERDASFLVRPQGYGLMLHGGEWFDTDVWKFDALWERATEADNDGIPSVALEAMCDAVALWRDDPSELAGDEWALPDVEERRLRLVQMAARAGELLLARDDPEAARRKAEAALSCDPWCERAHHVVVAAHLAGGFHRAARDALQRYSEVLVELGMHSADRQARLAKLTRGNSGILD